MTDKTDTPDDPIWSDAPYTADELARGVSVTGRTGAGRTTVLTSLMMALHNRAGDEAVDSWIDPAGEATDLPDDLPQINPLDGDPSDDEPSAGGDS